MADDFPALSYIKTVCRIGQGAACCRYLTMGPGGWRCEKLTTLRATLDAANHMVARGDNCPGRGNQGLTNLPS